MIIDCHGHYTTAPGPHNDWRENQLSAFQEGRPTPGYPAISDDEIRESIEQNQLRLLRERGADMTVFSPRASAMAHHQGDERVSGEWARACNDLIARVVGLFPETFIGVCQLPQSPGTDLKSSVAELERCVAELGFVGCNLNPDPSGGRWTAPPLTDRYWYPIYEKMVELDVPAMVHASSSCNPSFHATGARYDDLVTGREEPVDVSAVNVSTNGIELQDREFIAAIREAREPNSSVAGVLGCYRVLGALETQLASQL